MGQPKNVGKYTIHIPFTSKKKVQYTYTLRKIPGFRPPNERRRYKVTPSLIG